MNANTIIQVTDHATLHARRLRAEITTLVDDRRRALARGDVYEAAGLDKRITNDTARLTAWCETHNVSCS